MSNNHTTTNIDSNVVHRMIVEAKITDLERTFRSINIASMFNESASESSLPVFTVQEVRTLSENGPVDPSDKGGAVRSSGGLVAGLGADLVVDTIPASRGFFCVVFVDTIEVTGPGGGVEELLSLDGGPISDIIAARTGVSGERDTRDAMLFTLGFKSTLNHLDFFVFWLVEEFNVLGRSDGVLVHEIRTIFFSIGLATTHHSNNTTFDERLVGIRVGVIGGAAPFAGDI